MKTIVHSTMAIRINDTPWHQYIHYDGFKDACTINGVTFIAKEIVVLNDVIYMYP
jgi:hypothetical protein